MPFCPIRKQHLRVMVTDNLKLLFCEYFLSILITKGLQNGYAAYAEFPQQNRLTEIYKSVERSRIYRRTGHFYVERERLRQRSYYRRCRQEYNSKGRLVVAAI